MIKNLSEEIKSEVQKMIQQAEAVRISKNLTGNDMAVIICNDKRLYPHAKSNNLDNARWFQYRSGHRFPSISNVVRIAKFINYDLNRLKEMV